ncbi:hypothetical protein AOC36_07520 [Erysipelothrix larvae]|uniref:Phosphoesterase n=1 Tax=Erysipelothrix larvae TaxID=1514105 RepID=A0A109UH80_9FIRM|nr:DUF1294 domain-containing protein [Erysipelothrix larvae]AMC93838.1 hypothetical protein AOC36_07520 [Erysipelothrix larvae]
MNPLTLYLLVISCISSIVTLYDKSQAIHKRWRIKESTLFMLAVFGGALAMILTMLVIRHKTKHKRFMLGLPLIIFAQCALLIWAYC